MVLRIGMKTSKKSTVKVKASNQYDIVVKQITTNCFRYIYAYQIPYTVYPLCHVSIWSCTSVLIFPFLWIDLKGLRHPLKTFDQLVKKVPVKSLVEQ